MAHLDRRGHQDYTISDFKYCSGKISELLVNRILGDFLSRDDIYMQESIMVLNAFKILPMNNILSLIFSQYFNGEDEIQSFELLMHEKDRLSDSFAEKMSELLQIMEPLNSIASEKSPKYKKQACLATAFIDNAFDEFKHIEELNRNLKRFKCNIESGVLLNNDRKLPIKRYIFQRDCLHSIDYLIHKYYDNKINELINTICIQIRHINNNIIPKMTISDPDIVYFFDIDSIKNDHLVYLHRMCVFINANNSNCQLSQFYENKNIVQRTNLVDYKKFLSKYILEIDILKYWEKYFGNIDFFQMAMILVANKIYYDHLCKKYKIIPHIDGGIEFILESFYILLDIPLYEFMFY